MENDKDKPVRTWYNTKVAVPHSVVNADAGFQAQTDNLWIIFTILINFQKYYFQSCLKLAFLKLKCNYSIWYWIRVRKYEMKADLHPLRWKQLSINTFLIFFSFVSRFLSVLHKEVFQCRWAPPEWVGHTAPSGAHFLVLPISSFIPGMDQRGCPLLLPPFQCHWAHPGGSGTRLHRELTF